MEPLIPRPSFFPTLLFDPNVENACAIAARLTMHRISVRVAHSAADALESINDRYFRVIFVVADLHDRQCLRFLDSVHCAAPRSWLIVADECIDRDAEALVYRHGGDALVGTPVDVHELVDRIASFQAASRPLY
jgi:DNA-binding response OmpR family regulator